jgi:hypothetical protein
VHVPRRFYVQRLPGIPTIRVFEALACGIPLVCSPWDGLRGACSPRAEDYLVARQRRGDDAPPPLPRGDAALRAASLAARLATSARAPARTAGN